MINEPIETTVARIEERQIAQAKAADERYVAQQKAWDELRQEMGGAVSVLCDAVSNHTHDTYAEKDHTHARSTTMGNSSRLLGAAIVSFITLVGAVVGVMIKILNP